MSSTEKYETVRKLKNKIIIDVRSPLEFSEFTIPGAINIPVLLNDERAEVGTLYVHDKIDEAKILAIESVSKRLPSIVAEILELRKVYDNLVFFCARGGYRSKTITSLLSSLDIRVIKLEGGYKKYRKYILNSIDDIVESITPIILYGNTGTGKTEILKRLKNNNLPVVDLEGLASHRGSILGAVGLNAQPSQKMFDSLLFEELEKYKNSYVFLEGESRRIGKVLLPEKLYDKMSKGINIKINSPIENRIELLVNEYASNNNKSEITEAISHMNKYISKENLNKLLYELENDNFAFIARELCVNYYDIRYKNRVDDFDLEFLNEDLDKVTAEIIKHTSKYF